MSKKGFSKKLLSVTTMILVITGIISTLFLANKGNIYQIKAGPGQDPKEVEITNIFEDSFTVSFFTNDQVLGTINYSDNINNLDNVSLDDRDQLNQTANKYNIHSITVRNLKPLTTYYFVIISGDKKYLDRDMPYSIKTGPIITQNPLSQIPISGKVILPNGTSPNEGLVYANIEGAQKISTLISNDGIYLLPMNSLRDSKLINYFSLNSIKKINIKVKTSNLYSSINISPKQINQIPLITASSNYDFSNDISTTPIFTQTSKQTFPKIPGKKRNNIKIYVTQPPTPTLKPIVNNETETPAPIPSLSRNKILNAITSIKSLFIK